MTQWYATVRESLLKDGKTCNQLKRIKWSINSLADLNPSFNPTKKNKTQLLTNTSNFQKKETIINRDAAEIFLQDIGLRLAGQYSKCLTLINQIQQKNHENEWKSQIKSQNKTKHKRKIIRAVNHPIQNMNLKYNEYISILQERELYKTKVIKSLQNMETLHFDTYQLVYQLLAKDRPTIKRFQQADQNLIAATFTEIRSRHSSSVETMADIVCDIKSMTGRLKLSEQCNNFNKENKLLFPHEHTIDSFLRGRLGIQLLCDHYISLHNLKPYGTITFNCNFAEVIEAAVTESKIICTQNMLIAPDVHVSFQNTNGQMTLIRPWMHHVLVEVLKNAMASSAKKMILSKNDDNVPPPIHIQIVEKKDCFDCMIVDNGVGLSDEHISKAFKFAETGSSRRWDRLEAQQSYAAPQTATLGGMGVGLPLSLMMMQMFGGDIYLQNRSSISFRQEGDEGMETGCIVTIRIMKDTLMQQKLY